MQTALSFYTYVRRAEWGMVTLVEQSPFVWVIDPRTRRAIIYTAAGRRPVTDGILRAGKILVPLAELYDAA